MRLLKFFKKRIKGRLVDDNFTAIVSYYKFSVQSTPYMHVHDIISVYRVVTVISIVGLVNVTIVTENPVNKMSDVESEELEDQGPNLGVCAAFFVCVLSLMHHRVMKETVMSKKKDTDMVKLYYQMAILTKDIILMVNVTDR